MDKRTRRSFAVTGDIPDEVAPFESKICVTEAERLDFWRNNCKFVTGGAHLISLLRRQLLPVAAAPRLGYKRATGTFA